jgi:predicted DNA-binding transcriptional regulator AlpA
MTATEDPKQNLCSEGALTVSQAEEFSGIGRTSLYGLMGQGRLPYAKLYGRRLIPKRALVALLADGLVGGGTGAAE